MRNKSIDVQALIREHSNGKNDAEMAAIFNCSRGTVQRYRSNLQLEPNYKTGITLSDDSKKKISEKRKEWLKNNPDKHPWRSKDKFQSKPCEKVKEYLRTLGVNFLEEFSPEIPGRYFSIDIALPEKKIAIEINGNQHYEKNGILKPYYQERHDLLETNGWTVYEIHYSLCFNFSKWAEFVYQIKNTETTVDFDYVKYTHPHRAKKHRAKKESVPSFCLCGNKKNFAANKCLSCYNFSQRKVERPSKQELEQLIKEIPMMHISKRYGVSDNAVKKWCKSYGIILPNMRGYWAKKAAQDKLQS